MNNQMQKQGQRLPFSAYINSPTGQNLVGKALPDARQRSVFVTALVAAVSNNPALQECTPDSVISAALQGTALGLTPSPQLGQFYMVPFKDKKRGATIATFVCGFKGLIQLALRSGQYLDINAMEVREGEYLGRDSMTGRPVFQFVQDDDIREELPVIGYMASFELINGAKKAIYWSREKMINHADKFSPAFSKGPTGGRYPKVSFEDYCAGRYPKDDEWRYSSFWYKDFNTMSLKTVLRALLSKWGPMSVDMVSAVEADTKSEAAGADIAIDIPFTQELTPALPREDIPEDAIQPAPAQAPPVEGEVRLDDI